MTIKKQKIKERLIKDLYKYFDKIFGIWKEI